MEHYLKEADCMLVVSSVKIQEVRLALRTIEQVGDRRYLRVVNEVSSKMRSLICERKDLEDCVFIVTSQPDPDNGLAREIIDHTSEMKALIYDLEQLLA